MIYKFLYKKSATYLNTFAATLTGTEINSDSQPLGKELHKPIIRK